MAAITEATALLPCSRCGVEVLHTAVELLGPQGTWWRKSAHRAPCGQPCFGGGATQETKPWDQMHGWSDRCPKCGPMRVLPEVVEEMRERSDKAMAFAGDDPSGLPTALRSLATDVRRCLDEIEKLTGELDDTRQALDLARDELTARRMAMEDAEFERAERTEELSMSRKETGE